MISIEVQNLESARILPEFVVIFQNSGLLIFNRKISTFSHLLVFIVFTYNSYLVHL